MKNLTIPYGDKNLSVEIDEEDILGILQGPMVTDACPGDILAASIRHPLTGHTVEQFMQDSDRIVFLVNDATRPTRTDLVLDALDDTICRSEVEFIVATGAHPSPAREELRRIFGPHLDECEGRTSIHDARNEKIHKNIGRTRYGNDMYVNRQAFECSKMVAVGSVEPHYFAGFTGGPKSLLPGIAAYETIERNHSLALHERSRPLVIEGNPIHEEMVDCMDAFGRDRIYGVQMVLDSEDNVCRAFSGPLHIAFDAAVRDARKIFSAPIKHQADIVVTVARPPFDCDLYQTLKTIEHGRLALRPGGTLIFVSACPEGLGPPHFSRLFENTAAIADAAQRARTEYTLGDHNAHNLLTLRQAYSIWAVTEIADDLLANAGIERFATLQEALSGARKNAGRGAKILFLLNGARTVPVLT